LAYATDDEIDNLVALEQGAYGPGPFRFYDPFAAQTNMLPDVLAAAGTGPAPWRWVGYDKATALAGGPIELADGRTLAQSLIPQQTLTFPVRNNNADPIPVFPGRAYTASAHLAGGLGTISLVWTDAAGDIITSGAVMSDFTTGRISATGEAPVNAAGVLIRISAGDITSSLNLQGAAWATTPDAAGLDILGDLDVRADLIPDDMPPASNVTIISKYEPTGNQRSWQLVWNATGTLQFFWSPDGSTFIQKGSSIPVSSDPGERIRVRVTLDVNNGVGQNVVTFYTAQGSSGWTQLGDPRTTTGTTSIYNSNAPVQVGVRSSGVSQYEGQIFWAEARNGINGTIVARPDFTADGPWAVGDDSTTGARNDSAGVPWTLAGAAVIDEVITPSETTQLGGLQLTETDDTVSWAPGLGMPHVMLSGLSDHTYRRLAPGNKYRDIEFEMIEVS
jgi:hypothetical protein